MLFRGPLIFIIFVLGYPDFIWADHPSSNRSLPIIYSDLKSSTKELSYEIQKLYFESLRNPKNSTRTLLNDFQHQNLLVAQSRLGDRWTFPQTLSILASSTRVLGSPSPSDHQIAYQFLETILEADRLHFIPAQSLADARFLVGYFIRILNEAHGTNLENYRLLYSRLADAELALLLTRFANARSPKPGSDKKTLKTEIIEVFSQVKSNEAFCLPGDDPRRTPNLSKALAKVRELPASAKRALFKDEQLLTHLDQRKSGPDAKSLSDLYLEMAADTELEPFVLSHFQLWVLGQSSEAARREILALPSSIELAKKHLKITLAPIWSFDQSVIGASYTFSAEASLTLLNDENYKSLLPAQLQPIYADYLLALQGNPSPLVRHIGAKFDSNYSFVMSIWKDLIMRDLRSGKLQLIQRILIDEPRGDPDGVLNSILGNLVAGNEKFMATLVDRAKTSPAFKALVFGFIDEDLRTMRLIRDEEFYQSAFVHLLRSKKSIPVEEFIRMAISRVNTAEQLALLQQVSDTHGGIRNAWCMYLMSEAQPPLSDTQAGRKFLRRTLLTDPLPGRNSQYAGVWMRALERYTYEIGKSPQTENESLAELFPEPFLAPARAYLKKDKKRLEILSAPQSLEPTPAQIWAKYLYAALRDQAN